MKSEVTISRTFSARRNQSREAVRPALALVLVMLAAAFFTGCEDDDSDEQIPDVADGADVEPFDRRFRLRFDPDLQPDNCGDSAQVYELGDIASFSDIVATARVEEVIPVLEPVAFSLDGFSGSDCNGTLAAGLDLVLTVDAVLLGDPALETEQITLRITSEELSDVYDARIISEDGAISWIGIRRIEEGDRLAFTAIQTETDDRYGLAGHPFAFLNEGQVVPLSDAGYQFECKFFDYADDLYDGAEVDLAARVSAEGTDQASLRATRETELFERFIPATAFCFVSFNSD